MKGSRRTPALLAILMAHCLAVVACQSTEANSQTISRSDFGEEWPLTVDRGVLSCEGAGSVYFTADDGSRYAVNGTAMTTGDAQQIDAIWADDPTGLSPKRTLAL